MKQRVVIVGAGMVGSAIAYELSRRGVGVTVLDAGEPARGCSYGNSGLIAPGHEPMSAPGVYEKYTRERANPRSAGRFAPVDDPALERWIERFRAASAPEPYARGVEALSGLAHLVMPLFREWTTDLGNTYDMRESGALILACSDEKLATLRAEAENLRAHDLPVEVLDAPQTREREPAVRDSVVGALFHPDWTTIEPYQFATAVLQGAVRRGAEARTHARVASVGDGFAELTSGERIEGDAVVVTTGADARELLAPLGVDLPMASAVGWHADVRGAGAVRVGTVVADKEVILTPMQDRLRLSGLLEISVSPEPGVDPARIAQLREGAEHALAGIDGEVVGEWVGRRPCLADGLPAIGAVPGTSGVYTAVGHARMGLTLAPATGRLIAEMILGAELSAQADAFAPARFSAASV